MNIFQLSIEAITYFQVNAAKIQKKNITLAMGHSRKHPYLPHRGNCNLIPLPPSDVLIHLIIIRNRFLLPPSRPRPVRGGGGQNTQGAQRGPEISVKCSYIVYQQQFPEGQGPMFTNRHFVPGPVGGGGGGDLFWNDI